MGNDAVRSSQAGVRGQGFSEDGGLRHVHVKASIKEENTGKFGPHLQGDTELRLDIAAIIKGLTSFLGLWSSFFED